MNWINKLDVTITRWDCGVVRGIEIAGGEPDACGNRYLVSVYQHDWDGGYIIQTNFGTFYEQRKTLKEAYGVALWLATALDADGDKPEPDYDQLFDRGDVSDDSEPTWA